MGMTGTMKGYGSAARFKAEAAGHRMKDRMLESHIHRKKPRDVRLTDFQPPPPTTPHSQRHQCR